MTTVSRYTGTSIALAMADTCGRRHAAARVHAVRDHEHCAMPVVALAPRPGRLANRIEERRDCPTACPSRLTRRTRSQVFGELHDLLTSVESNVKRAASSPSSPQVHGATPTASRARSMLPPMPMLPLMSSSTARLTGSFRRIELLNRPSEARVDDLEVRLLEVAHQSPRPSRTERCHDHGVDAGLEYWRAAAPEPCWAWRNAVTARIPGTTILRKHSASRGSPLFNALATAADLVFNNLRELRPHDLRQKMHVSVIITLSGRRYVRSARLHLSHT